MYFPREDSYFLSEILSEFLKQENEKARILDMGSGSGIQALTCIRLGFRNILCADIDKESVTFLKTTKFLANVRNPQNSKEFWDPKIRDFRGFGSRKSKRFSRKQKLKAVNSNLFEKIKTKFDLIIFNPPYLAEHKFDNKQDTTGGKKGDETILAFLHQAKKHLNQQGKILLLLSSYTPRQRINKLIKKLKYQKTKLAQKNLFFEKIEIWLIS